ncbi:MAG: McrC family protein [Myxococcota bacterium]
MKPVVLVEHGQLWCEGRRNADSEDDLRNRTVTRAAFDALYRYDTSRPESERIFEWHPQHARATQWVGVIQLPQLLIEILPKLDAAPRGKVAGQKTMSAASTPDLASEDEVASVPEPLKPAHRAQRNLLYMLAVAGDVPLRPQDVARLDHQASALSETLAALFADRLLKEMLRGPARDYQAREENLRTLKGKLKLGLQVRHNAGHMERFFCEYEAFTDDIPLNRVFRAVCRLLLGMVRQSGTQDLLRRCLLMLDDVRDVRDPRALLPHITLTRQLERFAELFSFARLFLEHHAPLPGAGDARCFSLMFDMNMVFEGFIAGLLRSRVVPRLPGVLLDAQSLRTRRHLLETPTGTPVLRLKPDLVLKHRLGALLIIDTKWKRLTAGRHRSGVGRDDLYQLYAYATRYEARHSILLYPRVPGVEAADYQLSSERMKEGTPPQQVGVRFVHLQGELWRSSARQALQEELHTIVRQGLGLAEGDES